MPADALLVSKGLAFISLFLLMGFYTSHYLRSVVGDGFVHSGNLNDVGWTGLMGGEGDDHIRMKRHTGSENFGTMGITSDSADIIDDEAAESRGDSPAASNVEPITEENLDILDNNMAKYSTSDSHGTNAGDTEDFDEDDDDANDLDEFDTDDMFDTNEGTAPYFLDTESTGATATVSGSTDNPLAATGETVTSETGSPATVTGSPEQQGSSTVVATTEPPTTEPPTTTPPPTTQPPRDYMRTVEPDSLSECQTQPFIIQDACPKGGEIEFVSSVNVTMDDLNKVLFDTDVLEALENKCDNSTWCLGHEYDKILWYSSQMYKSYCNFIPCLLNVPEECLTDERKITIATLILLCESDLNNITNPCLLGLRRMTHVALLSLFRSRDEEMADTVCVDKYAKKCSGPCYEYSHQLFCAYESCNSTTLWIFQDYGPWQWLFNDESKLEKCEVADANCTKFQAPSSLFVHVPDNFTARILAKIMDMDNKLAVGLISSLFVGFTAFGLVVYACIKKIRKDAYNRNKVEYSRLTKDDELEDA